MYSLRPKILVIEMDVSRCILVLDTSILMTSNSGRREYLVQTRNKVGVGEFSMYSLRSELLVSEMDVSRTKIHLDTSISATSNSKRREYIGLGTNRKERE